MKVKFLLAAAVMHWAAINYGGGVFMLNNPMPDAGSLMT